MDALEGSADPTKMFLTTVTSLSNCGSSLLALKGPVTAGGVLPGRAPPHVRSLGVPAQGERS